MHVKVKVRSLLVITLLLSALQQLSRKTESKETAIYTDLAEFRKRLHKNQLLLLSTGKFQTKKRLVAQKQAIGEDYYTDLLSLKTELDPNENAVVKAKFSDHSLGVFRNGMSEKKKKKHLYLMVF